MWSIPTRKYSGATRLKRKRSLCIRDQRGQGILEYVLILAVVIGIFLTMARPFINKLGPKYQKVFKSGMFKEDDTGSNFYYFPVR